MNWRGVLALVAALFVSACNNSPSEKEQLADMEAANEELRGRIRDLEQQLETSQAAAASVKSDAEAVQAAGSQLRIEVDRLRAENWRDVVTDIESATGLFETTQSRLDDSVAELDETLAQ